MSEVKDLKTAADEVLDRLTDIQVEIIHRQGYWDRAQREIDYLQQKIDRQLDDQTKESTEICALQMERENLKGLL